MHERDSEYFVVKANENRKRAEKARSLGAVEYLTLGFGLFSAGSALMYLAALVGLFIVTGAFFWWELAGFALHTCVAGFHMLMRVGHRAHGERMGVAWDALADTQLAQAALARAEEVGSDEMTRAYLFTQLRDSMQRLAKIHWELT